MSSRSSVLAVAACLAFVFLGGCVSDSGESPDAPLSETQPLDAQSPDAPPSGSSGTAGMTDPLAVGGGVPANAFPFSASSASFTTRDGDVRRVNIEPTPTGVRMTITDGVAKLGHMDWRRSGDDILLSDGPDRWVIMLRIGAVPGTSWNSSGREIRFDGWERVSTPAGQFDAVRITSSAVTSDLTESETWWFSPGEGLVRLAQDKGGLFRTEMWRTR